MGTSQSSKGPGSNVSMVPPWVPEVEKPSSTGAPATPAPNDGNTDNSAQTPSASVVIPAEIAVAGRFGSARTSLSSFAKSGDKGDMRQAVGQYIKKGYGGTNTAGKRFGGTVSTAGKLYGALSALSAGQGQTIDGNLDEAVITGKSAREIVDRIVQAVSPTNGTQDAEASRVAINDALTELLTSHPNADLLNLTDDEKSFVIERFVSIDVFKRFELDLGFTIQEKAPTVALALARLKEVREYIKETVSLSFQKLKGLGQKINQKDVNKVVKDALKESLIVFQDYLS